MSRVMIEMNELIDEISMGPFGSDIKVDNFVDKGVPVLNGSNVTGVRLTEESFNYVTLEKAKSLKKANVKRGDIVITHRGTLGQIAFIPENSLYDNYVISQSQFKVTLKADKVDPAYFTYYFHTNEGQKRLLSFKNHVGVPALAQATTNFRKLEFPLIPLAEQQKIAKVLSDLDAKIELNNKINMELEAMAKTFYDYWFVQFDFPDANGKPYKSSGGKMVYNEELKREIPVGWEVKRLIDIENNIVTGKTPSTAVEEYFGGEIPFVTIDDIRKQLYIFNSERTLTKLGADSQSSKYLRPGDICVSCIGTIGVIGIVGKECQTNQQINSISITKAYNRYFLLNALKKFFEFNSSTAKQGAVLVNMNKGDFSDIKILDCTKELKEIYNKVVSSFYNQIENNLKENQELASLRDWLLPMLMNGQVTVGDEILRQAQDDKLSMVAEDKVAYKKG
ncbi:conserved hypothetical protein [Flavobacterium sp. 9AF]|uniref:restriction endonuclease subunit S n=1 Tax=Flavobacterium sp. 9AF TaxID=2653142 RepID=UPI0012F39E9D|nr:restriction endonuclease subunit S [Flavobacterium sp. 9AF]VXA97953.1 conserved hypothetical protein [Flavobacterium sp. 9AF]